MSELAAPRSSLTVPESGGQVVTIAPEGLSEFEAGKRLASIGPNAVPEERPRIWQAFLTKFWAPVPWMLEVTIALELILGRSVEAIIFSLLLVLNAVLSFLQENRAQAALALLRARLTVETRVRRDGQWRRLPARDLVPGDLVHLRQGDLVPADVRLTDGHLLADQSTLTGESQPVELEPGATAHAGSVVARGEANAEVISTGARTAFGKTAELVRTARTVSHLEQVILRIVRALVLLDLGLVVALLIYAALLHLAWGEILPFALILLIASVPVAMPATFTLATALGALELSRRGVLVTRLSAIEEAAGMDVLCTDKTGTITENRLALGGLHAYGSHSEDDVLRLAALASDQAYPRPARPGDSRGESITRAGDSTAPRFRAFRSRHQALRGDVPHG